MDVAIYEEEGRSLIFEIEMVRSCGFIIAVRVSQAFSLKERDLIRVFGRNVLPKL